MRSFKNLALAALAMLAEKNDLQMAAPADKVPDVTVPITSTDDIRQQMNNVITALRGIAAKLDLDAGVTDVNYFSLWLDAAISTAPVKVKIG